MLQSVKAVQRSKGGPGDAYLAITCYCLLLHSLHWLHVVTTSVHILVYLLFTFIKMFISTITHIILHCALKSFMFFVHAGYLALSWRP